MSRMQSILIVSLLSALMLIPSVIAVCADADDSDDSITLGAGYAYEYTYPEVVRLNVGDDPVDIVIDNSTITNAYKQVYWLQKGVITTNFPSWIFYMSTNPTHWNDSQLCIRIIPSAARDTVYWLELKNTDTNSVYRVNIPVSITGTGDTGGGDVPVILPGDYTYTYPGNVKLDVNSKAVTLSVVDPTILDYASKVLLQGSGSYTTNFPNWIYHNMINNKALVITITPAAAVDTQYYMCFTLPDQSKAYLLLNCKVLGSAPVDGGSEPVRPHDPVQPGGSDPSPDGNTIYIYDKTVWNYISEILTNTYSLVIISLSLIFSAVMIRRRSRW